MSRVIVESANMRDLGGLATPDTQVLRDGRLVRSGRLGALDEGDLARVRGLRLRTVIDLRRPTEVAVHPPPALPGVRTMNISTSVDDNEFAVIANRLDANEFHRDPEEMAQRYFRNIVSDGLGRYRPVFDVIMDPTNHPLLFHCTAGKDRAGFVAACLLGMLGVDDETILDDYEATNLSRGDLIAERRDGLSEAGNDAQRMLDMLLVAQRPFMAAALDEVSSRFGDWHELRRRALGIDDGRFARFRSAVLINARIG